MDEAANLAQQAAIAINMKKKGKKPKRMNEGSLHKWFKGSKSKDGKGGWVNVVTGGTCASDEPGEGTPKCVSSSKRASMSKKERLSASRRKKKADPGQQSKTGAAKPTYVSTDKKKKMTEELEYIDLPLEVEIPNSESKFNLGLMFRESLDIDKGMLFIFEEVGQHSFHMKNTRIPLDVAFVKEDGTIESIKELNPHTLLPVSSDGEVLFAIEANRGWFIENNVEVGDEIVLGEAKDKKGKGSGSKDACYHKVKSRYSVWPSAYASGALVKCRKVGAANWGNSRKEEVEYEVNEMKSNPDFVGVGANKKYKESDSGTTSYGHINSTKTGFTKGGAYSSKFGKDNPIGKSEYDRAKMGDEQKKKIAAMKPKVIKSHYDWRSTLDEKCWAGYEKKGMKTMFGKRYPNCVKKSKKKK